MGKKKGAALVMVIAVTSILIILSLSILQVSTSSFKNDIALERINQVRLFAESGIEQAIAQLKNSSNISVPVITSADNIMTCNVAITTYDSAKKQYKIVSSASGAGFSKTITAVYQKSGLIGGSGGGTPEQVSDLVNNYLIKNAVTLFVNSAADNVFNWYSNLNAANNAITIFGNMYLSGNNINFTPDILYLYGNIMYQGDSSIIEQMKNNKGTINGIIQTSSIPPSIYPVIDTSSINKVVLYTSGGKNLIGYTTNQNSNLNDINQIINNSIYNSSWSKRPGGIFICAPGFNNVYLPLNKYKQTLD